MFSHSIKNVNAVFHHLTLAIVLKLQKKSYLITECAAPSADFIANGFISLDADSYLVGTTLTYSCDMGFATRDDVVTECQDITFTWTLDSNPPTCIRSKKLSSLQEF